MEKLVIKLGGEIDHHSSPAIKRRMDEQFERRRPGVVVIDMSGVRFMDSSGIGLLLGRYREWKRSGTEIYIKNPREQVDRVLTMSGLYQICKKVEK